MIIVPCGNVNKPQNSGVNATNNEKNFEAELLHAMAQIKEKENKR